jgi:hypothetical protein
MAPIDDVVIGGMGFAGICCWTAPTVWYMGSIGGAAGLLGSAGVGVGDGNTINGGCGKERSLEDVAGW